MTWMAQNPRAVGRSAAQPCRFYPFEGLPTHSAHLRFACVPAPQNRGLSRGMIQHVVTGPLTKACRLTMGQPSW